MGLAALHYESMENYVIDIKLKVIGTILSIVMCINVSILDFLF